MKIYTHEVGGKTMLRSMQMKLVVLNIILLEK
jgi:hypothetical protein